MQLYLLEVDNMLEYKKMTWEELDECSLLAAEAFYDYEYFTIYFTQEKRRQRFINPKMPSKVTLYE